MLHPTDSLDQHFRDTIEGGGYLNDQELAWTLVKTAPERIRELEDCMGCFFDRNPDGAIHQKAFAGQSFDRTVHRGDLTGIEIITRLMEQVFRRNIPTLEDDRAIELFPPRTAMAWLEPSSSTYVVAHSSWYEGHPLSDRGWADYGQDHGPPWRKRPPTAWPWPTTSEHSVSIWR